MEFRLIIILSIMVLAFILPNATADSNSTKVQEFTDCYTKIISVMNLTETELKDFKSSVYNLCTGLINSDK